MTRHPASPITAVLPDIQSGALAGAVALVASKDRILELEAIGYADLAARAPMRTDHMFWIASMTKPVTATLLMMLVDEGKLNLHDPVEKYLPEFRGQMLEVERDEQHVLLHRLDKPILLIDVLRHTSGLPFLSRLEPKIDVISLREATFAAAMTNLLSRPGERYLYSNCGTNVAGRIIEVASGLSFEQFLDDRLLRPLAMTDTTFWPSDSQVGRLAKTYTRKSKDSPLLETPISILSYPLTSRSRHVHPGGGLFSTASDVAQFCRMIMNGGAFAGRRYLSPESVGQMTTTQTGDIVVSKKDADAGYGLLWNTVGDRRTTDGKTQNKFGHGGMLGTSFWIYPESEVATVLLVQLQPVVTEDDQTKAAVSVGRGAGRQL